MAIAGGAVAVAVKPIARTEHGGRDLVLSPADEAALEWALRLGDRCAMPVVAVVAGSAGTEAVLHSMLAVGAAQAWRADVAADAPSDAVAAVLAGLAEHSGHDIRWWCCGERSGDRASGAVPALLAARLDRPAALGLLDVEGLTEGPGERTAPGPSGAADVDGLLTVERRLDRGRRELLAVRSPAVLSFAAGSAVLRRAALPAVLASHHRAIEVLPARAHVELSGAGRVRVAQRTPFRPRAKVLAAPRSPDSRQRIAALTGVFELASSAPRRIDAPPEEAAAAIIDALHTWGYLAEPAQASGADGPTTGRVAPPSP